MGKLHSERRMQQEGRWSQLTPSPPFVLPIIISVCEVTMVTFKRPKRPNERVMRNMDKESCRLRLPTFPLWVFLVFHLSFLSVLLPNFFLPKLFTSLLITTFVLTCPLSLFLIYYSILSFSIQTPNQWVPGALSSGVKRPGSEADHSLPSGAEVQNAWRHTSTPQYVFMAWCLVKYRDNFTFNFTSFFISVYHSLFLHIYFFFPFFSPFLTSLFLSFFVGYITMLYQLYRLWSVK
jgi:hypothetical protein